MSSPIITASAIAGTADVPEHCLVSGQVLPEIRFEIDLPVAWNRRLYMFWQWWLCWRVIRVAGIDRQRNLALSHGFAIAATNTGHDRAPSQVQVLRPIVKS